MSIDLAGFFINSVQRNKNTQCMHLHSKISDRQLNHDGWTIHDAVCKLRGKLQLRCINKREFVSNDLLSNIYFQFTLQIGDFSIKKCYCMM